MAELQYSLSNPLPEPAEVATPSPATDDAAPAGSYDAALALGEDLIQRPIAGGGPARVRVQHSKDRMTVWERIKVLTDREPMILYRNWGPELDGASIVTGILDINGRDVAVYGHDFTVRAGSIDATNGAKLARLICMAGEKAFLSSA